LDDIVRESGVTPFSFLLAAFGSARHRLVVDAELFSDWPGE
jgi:hypothetical protein